MTFKALVLSRSGIDMLAVVFAAALQIQLNLFAREGYAGLRVNLADFFLPAAGLWVLYTLLRRKSVWPVWSSGSILPALVALSCVMTMALINGYYANGGWSLWALVNKYAGFFVLLAYFLLGGWIATNAQDAGATERRLIRSFSGFFTVCLGLSGALLLLQPFVHFSLWLPRYPWDGLMANRNAYMVLAVMTGVFLLWGRGAVEKGDVGEKTACLFWALLPFFFIYNASRTGWIVFALLSLLALFTLPFSRMKKIFLFCAIGGVLAYGSIYVVNIADILKNKQFDNLIGLMENDEETLYIGDKKRLIALEDGLALYRGSNPLTGAGLGTYEPYQIKKRGAFVDVMDFTALWILVETGAIGLMAFAAFFLICLIVLHKRGFARGSPYHKSLFIFLLVFALMSCLHELAYTRFVWFFLGLGLAGAKRPKEGEP